MDQYLLCYTCKTVTQQETLSCVFVRVLVRSDDGVTWSFIIASEPFPSRKSHRNVIFSGRLLYIVSMRLQQCGCVYQFVRLPVCQKILLQSFSWFPLNEDGQPRRFALAFNLLEL